VGEDGEHAAMVAGGLGEFELVEDVSDVLGDRCLADDELAGDGGIGGPRAIRASVWRSRAVSRSSGLLARVRSSWRTTSASMTVPPSSTSCRESINVRMSATRSFSRYPMPLVASVSSLSECVCSTYGATRVQLASGVVGLVIGFGSPVRVAYPCHPAGGATARVAGARDPS
jgi:hypothetical protein